MASKRDNVNVMQGLRTRLDSEQNISTEQEVYVPKKQSTDWRDKIKTQLAPLVEFQCLLPGSEQIVTYKSMNTRDLKGLLIYQGVKDPVLLEEILDKLIESVVTSDDFSINDLYIYDKAFLLIQIRINSKGGSIESVYNCPNCNQMVLFNQELSNMKIIQKPTNIMSELKISPTFSIFLDYNTRKEQKEIWKFSTAKNEDDKIAELGLLTLASLIKAIKIDGEMITEGISPEDKVNIFMDLPESAFDKILAWDKESAFGYDLRYDRTCHHCGHTDLIEIPLSSMF